MDYVEMYYNHVWGYYPFDDNINKERSQKILDYLIDAGISESKILNYIENAPKVDFLTPETLPGNLWENSLLEKNKFYYHNLLHVISDAPKWNPITNKETVSNFFLEMVIDFTMEDLIRYFYGSYNINFELMDRNRDAGSFNYLLNKYKKFTFIEPLDFVLALIDYGKNSNDRNIRTILDIAQYESEVYEVLKAKTEQAKLERANRIVWRY